MSFVQEFTEQQLSKNISCHMLQQVQSCHSAVEELICNLEGLRTAPRLPFIDAKIERMQSYLAIKQELTSILQDSSQNAIIEWLLEHQINSPLLIAFLHKQTQTVKQMIQRAIKRVFLKGESLKEFTEQNQTLTSSLSQLKQLRQIIRNNRPIARQKIRSIDLGCQQMQHKLQVFNNQVKTFNDQILSIVRELQDFQANISSQFRSILAKR